MAVNPDDDKVQLGEKLPTECTKLDEFFTTEIKIQKEDAPEKDKNTVQVEDDEEVYERKGTPFISKEEAVKKLKEDYKKKGIAICDDEKDDEIPEDEKFIFAKPSTILRMKIKPAGDILIWDVGLSNKRNDHETETDYFFWGHGNFEDAIKELNDENKSNIKIHRPIPAAQLYGDLNASDNDKIKFARDFYDREANWDFYQDPPEVTDPPDPLWEDYWTRNIQDYKLVLYSTPMSSTISTSSLQPCCDPGCDTRVHSVMYYDGEPDHQFNGFPEWWDDVLTGAWSGRFFITTLTVASLFEAAAGYHGQLGVFSNYPQLPQLTPTEGNSVTYNNSSERNVNYSGDLFTDVITTWSGNHLHFPNLTGGGDTIMTADDIFYIDSWCHFGDNPQRKNQVCGKRQRSIVTIEEKEYNKDIIMMAPVTFSQSNAKKLYKNLYEVEIAQP